MDPEGYISFRSSSTVLAEGVYQFLRGGIYGSIWGMVSPFPSPGTAAAAAEATSGVFRPVLPFSSLSAIPTNAVLFGTILGVQRVSCKSLELVRRQEDIWNELFGFGVTYRYYTYFFANTEKRFVRHNRFVGGAFAVAIVYANFLA